MRHISALLILTLISLGTGCARLSAQEPMAFLGDSMGRASVPSPWANMAASGPLSGGGTGSGWGDSSLMNSRSVGRGEIKGRTVARSRIAGARRLSSIESRKMMVEVKGDGGQAAKNRWTSSIPSGLCANRMV